MKHLTVFVFIFLFTVQVQAGVFDRVLRQAAKVPDNIPIRQVDDIADIVKQSKSAREATENAVKRITKSADAVPSPAAVKAALKAELQALDPSLIRFADELDAPSQQVMLVMMQGAKSVNKTLPDAVRRAEFLQKAGVETVQAIGTYGDDIARGAKRLDDVLDGGNLVSPAGMRAVTLADYGTLFTKYGDAANRFVTKNVLPNWKYWLTGGALAWYLLDPDGFMDTAGKITEEGLKRLTQCAGDISGAVLDGVSKGLEQAIDTVVEKTGDATTRTFGTLFKSFFGSWKGVLALLVIAFAACCALPYTRFYLLKPFAFLFRKPRS